MLTREQAAKLAALAADCRPEASQPWDQPGILAALAKVRDLPLADVIVATIRAASDPATETPGAIAATKSHHWRERVTQSQAPRPPTPDQACHVCGKHADQCTGHAEERPWEALGGTWRPSEPASPERAHVHVQAAREALRVTRQGDQ